jgi:arylformamidase
MPMIDISLPLDSRTPIYPGDPPLIIESVATLDDAPFCLSRVAFGCHTGTHVDAPAHFVRGGARLIEIPLERYCGIATLLVLPEADEITAAMLQTAWPEGRRVERVLLKTPNSDRWDTPDAGRVFQALALDAAQWLVAQGVRLVGIDSLSIEKDIDKSFAVHHMLLGNDVLILEGLDLRAATAGEYELICLPIKLDVPDGGPVRAVLRLLTR